MLWLAAAGCSSTTRNYGGAGAGAGGGSGGGAGGSSAAGSGVAGSGTAGSSSGRGGDAGETGITGDAGEAGIAGADNANGGASGAAGTTAGGAAGTTAGGHGGSAGGGAGGAGGAAGAAGAGGCNNLTVSGPKLTLVNSSAQPPTMTNGTIKPGDYQLVTQTFYGGSGAFMPVVEVAHVVVNGQIATINIADSTNIRSTIIVTMAQPATMPPASAVMACSNDPFFSTFVGQDVKTALLYTATATSLSVYSVPGRDLLEFTLIQ